ncbi:hypothetical protein BSKO_12850 [Bryopsis sp. KO-2023]|nr:hypothetical protein BSKO_12850 [Bryopsis sp. KO-2023]
MPRSLLFFPALLLLLGPAAALLSSAHVPTLNATSTFPECTIMEPGGRWSVAITTETVPPMFGKARRTRDGTIEAYFPFVNHQEKARFRVIACGEGEKNASDPSGKSCEFEWMDLASAQRGWTDCKIVELAGSSPFSIPDARGVWQLGRIDSGLMTAWYVSGEGEGAFEVFVGGKNLRKGRVLCAAKSGAAKTEDLARGSKSEEGSGAIGAKDITTMAEPLGPSPGGISASRLSPVVTYALLAVIILNGIAMVVVLFAYRQLNAVNKKSDRTNSSDVSPSSEATREIAPINRSGFRSDHACTVSISTDIDQGEEESTTRAAATHTVNMDFTLKVEKTGRTIGFGNFGVVKEGILTDAKMGRVLVALKFPTRDQQDYEGDIVKELEVFSKIPPHRNIVKCFGGGTIGPRLGGPTIGPCRCLVEELMVQSLDDVVHADYFGNCATYRTAIGFFMDIVQGLEHLHRWGIVHCDLKPTNLLLDASNTVKIADFDISRKKIDSYITARLQGTLPYIAPEVFLAGFMPTLPIKANSIDVFSFGVIMWETVSGLDPNKTPDAEGSRKLRRGGLMKRTDDFKKRFPLNAFCPPELRDLIWDSVAFYAEGRPTCREIRERLGKMNDAVWLDQRIRPRQ